MYLTDDPPALRIPPSVEESPCRIRVEATLYRSQRDTPTEPFQPTKKSSGRICPMSRHSLLFFSPVAAVLPPQTASAKVLAPPVAFGHSHCRYPFCLHQKQTGPFPCEDGPPLRPSGCLQSSSCPLPSAFPSGLLVGSLLGKADCSPLPPRGMW